MNDFRLLANLFKKELPSLKLYIRRVKMPNGDMGDCQKIGKNKFLIRIDKTLTPDESYETLCHEISHACSWDKEKTDHNIEWGKQYSKIYNIYLKKFIENNEN